jgi:hypothetical protein
MKMGKKCPSLTLLYARPTAYDYTNYLGLTVVAVGSNPADVQCGQKRNEKLFTVTGARE